MSLLRRVTVYDLDAEEEKREEALRAFLKRENKRGVYIRREQKPGMFVSGADLFWFFAKVFAVAAVLYPMLRALFSL